MPSAQPPEKEWIFAENCPEQGYPKGCNETGLRKLINPVLKRLRPTFNSDSLKIHLEIQVNKRGKPGVTRIWSSLKYKQAENDLKEALIETIEKESFRVVQFNDSKYPSTHLFKLDYLLDSGSEMPSPLPLKKPYEGGVVLKIPLFPSQKREGDLADKQNFQKAMVSHVKKEFRYPEQALKEGVQGTVYVIFTIDADGRITNLRTRSPHVALDAEARRIVRLLPEFSPALQDEEPVKIPFSIPIVFRLQ
jgi:TonB family protein